MSIGQFREGPQSDAPPLIGRCLKCQAEILASHPNSWCTDCNEPIPYGINMQRRPIMYGTIKVFGPGFSNPELNPKSEAQAGLRGAVRTFLSFTQK